MNLKIEQQIICGNCHRNFQAEVADRPGIKYVQCKYCGRWDRLDLFHPLNNINNCDPAADYSEIQ